jgi:dnd system-associated protein 4
VTISSIEARIHRPKDKEELIQQMLAEEDGPFTTMRDVLLFAAAFGWSRRRSEKLGETGEPIRYEIFRRSATAEAFIDALGVISRPEDPLILADERLQDRISIFEEYANGGLAELQGEINASRATVTEVLAGLVRQQGSPGSAEGQLPPELEKFLAPADWS